MQRIIFVSSRHVAFTSFYILFKTKCRATATSSDLETVLFFYYVKYVFACCTILYFARAKLEYKVLRMTDVAFFILDKASCQKCPKYCVRCCFYYQEAKIRFLKHVNYVQVFARLDLFFVFSDGKYLFHVIMLKLVRQVVPNCFKLKLIKKLHHQKSESRSTF